MKTTTRMFEVLAVLEGTSFLLLLGVAMPLKYLAGITLATRILGMVHGLAFVAYEMQVLNALATKRWPGRTIALGALAGFLPLGTFYFMAHVRRREAPRAT